MNKSSSNFTLTSPKSTRNSSRQLLSPEARTNSQLMRKKILVVKSKISELILQKKQILKCIQQINLKTKESYKKEEELLTTSKKVEQKIRKLEKKKAFFLGFNRNEEVSEKMKLIVKLRGYLTRFEEGAKGELEVDLIENELDSKEFDYSLDTKSSDNNYSGTCSSKEQIKKQLLKNKICKVEFKQENLSFHTNINKKRKEITDLNKAHLGSELKSFAMEKEIFSIKSKKVSIFKQQVLRKHKEIQEKRGKIQSYLNDLSRLSAENDGYRQEVLNLAEKFSSKTQKLSLEMLHLRVSQKQEKIGILSESIRKKEKVVEVQKNRSIQYEHILWKKQESIKAKHELLEILGKIDQVINIPDTGIRKKTLVEEKKNNLRMLIQQALQKEQEILALDPN